MRRPGHWPSPVARDLLRVAFSDGERADRAWRRVLATTDIDTLDDGAARLLPLAHAKVRERGLADPWGARIRGIYRYWWAHNQQLVRLCATAVGRLEAGDVQTVVLKGIPLALDYYRDPGLRPMTDFDLLVRPADARRAIGLLADIGWQPERRVDEPYVHMLHGVSLHDPAGRTLDLHWAIHEDDVRPDADDEAWSTARPLTVGGVETRMLAPAPLLVQALAGGSKWAADPAVRWVADAVLIIRRDGVDWDAFVDEVIRRHFVVRSRACLAYLNAALDVIVPTAVSDRLADQEVSMLERLEHQVRTRTHPRMGELPRYWLAWRRTSPNAWRDPGGFGRYLMYAWNLPSARAVPAAAARRALWRLATGRPPARGLPTAAPPARDEIQVKQLGETREVVVEGVAQPRSLLS